MFKKISILVLISLLSLSTLLGLGFSSSAQYQTKQLPESKREAIKNAIKEVKIPKPSKQNSFTENAVGKASIVAGGPSGLITGFIINWATNQFLKATNSAGNDYRSYSDDKANYWAKLIIENNENVKYFGHDVVTDPYAIALQYNNELKKLKIPIEGVQKVYEVAEYPYSKTSRVEDVILSYQNFGALQGVDVITSLAPDVTIEFPDPTGISNNGFDKFFNRAFNFDLQPIKGLEMVKFPVLKAFSFFALIYFIIWIFNVFWDLEVRKMRDSQKMDYRSSMTRSLINKMIDLVAVFGVVFFIATGSLALNSLNSIYVNYISGTSLCTEIPSLGYKQSYCKTWSSINHHCLKNSITLKCSFIAGGMDLSLDNVINSNTATFDAFDDNILGQGFFFIVSNTNSMKVLIFQAIAYILLAVVSLRFIFPALKMLIFLILSPMLIYEYGAKEFYTDLANDFKGLFYSYAVFITLSIFLRNLVLSSLDPFNLFLWGVGVIIGMIVIPSMISAKIGNKQRNINLFSFAYGSVRRGVNMVRSPLKRFKK